MSVSNRKAELTGEVIMKVTTIQVATYVATHILNSACICSQMHIQVCYLSTFDRLPLLLEYMKHATILMH